MKKTKLNTLLKKQFEMGRIFDFSINLPTSLIALLCTCFALGLLIFLSFRVHDASIFGSGFTLANYLQIASDPLFATIIARSFVISSAVTLATVILSYPVAHYIAFSPPEKRSRMLMLVTLPFWTSYLLRVFSWKIILGYNGIFNSGLMELGLIEEPLAFLLYTPTAMVITLAHAYAAFAVLPMYASLSAINKNLIEAGSDLGANRYQIFFKIILPLAMPGILAASAIVFIPTLGDFVTPLLVGGPDSFMVGNLIASQFGNASNWPLGAALVVTVMVTLLTLLALRQLASNTRQRLAV